MALAASRTQNCRPRAGGFVAAQRAAQGERLAGDHARHRVARMHAVYLSIIQAMIWQLVFTSGAGMSRSGPMMALDLGDEAAAQPLQFAHAELLGVDDDAALAAAIGDIHGGALPGHPHGERSYFVNGHVLVEANAALGRAAGEQCCTR